MNYLQEHGKKLVQLGYTSLPLLPRLKGVFETDWTNIITTDEHIDKWLRDGYKGAVYKGIGIQSKYTPAVDLDIREKELCEIMIQKVHEICGNAPVRIGMPPKALLPFRTSEPFAGCKSPVFTSPDGEKHQIEILADGQQFVAYNIHKDTGKPYEWSKDLMDIPWSELPELDIEKADQIIKFFEQECRGRGWVPNKKQYDPNSRITLNQSTIGLSVDEIQKYLNDVDPEPLDYEDWLNVGMGICHETCGSDEGFELWLKWSEQSSKHNKKGMSSSWISFKKPRGGRRITFRTARKMAREARMERAPLGEFVRRYVYVGLDDSIHDLDGSAEDKNVKLKAFKVMMGKHNMEIEVPAPIISDPHRVKQKTVSVISQWLVHPEQKVAKGFEYDPEQGRMIEEGGYLYINQFHMPEFAEPEGGSAAWEKLIEPFTEHMKYLFSKEEEREWFLNWMAVNVQHPEKRCKVVPLHVSIHHGTGRGWLVKVMETLLGDWNCHRPKMPDIVEGQFREYLDRSLLGSVEEVREGTSKPYEVNDAIRDILIEDRLSVNLKFGTKQMQDIYANFFLMTNHPDALVIKSEDRRINVFQCNAQPRSQEYYVKIYKWLEGDSKTEPSVGMCALYHLLKNKSLNGFNWQRSFHNEAREEMILNRQNVVEQALEEFIENPPYFAMQEHGIVSKVEDILTNRFPGQEYEVSKIPWQARKFLSGKGWGAKRLGERKGEERPRYRILKRGEYSDEQIRNELKKQGEVGSNNHPY
jgi:primase-like protein/uncharacterized protein DUF5906